jgi:hypothetical protein
MSWVLVEMMGLLCPIAGLVGIVGVEFVLFPEEVEGVGDVEDVKDVPAPALRLPDPLPLMIGGCEPACPCP